MLSLLLARKYVEVRADKTWEDAKSNCAAMGARLMEVRNQEEFDRALRFRLTIPSPIWLGGSDIQVEGNWVWDSNGEAVNLNQFWLETRPDNSPSRNCILLDRGMFDFGCNYGQSSFCEFN